MPGSTHQHVFTQCTLSLNDWEASWAGLCQCGSFVMFVPNAKILTDVSENPTVLKNPVCRNPRTLFKIFFQYHSWRGWQETRYKGDRSMEARFKNVNVLILLVIDLFLKLLAVLYVSNAQGSTSGPLCDDHNSRRRTR